MPLNNQAIQHLAKLLTEAEASEIVRLAKQQDSLEARWRKKFQSYIDELLGEVVADALESGRIKSSLVDFEPLVMKHSFEVTKAAIDSTHRMKPVKLGAAPKIEIPKSLRALREWWDKYRKRGVVPKRQKDISKKLKDAFLRKLQSIWEKNSEDFRSGNAEESEKARVAIQRTADVTYSRAKMVVETETTHYYNKVRKDIYDQSDDVTHYLFMAVRDFATTRWCGTRHGLVYAKGDPLFEKEVPPIHWNCRSEILPLTPLNPTHKKIIDDKSKARRQNVCEPLPKGWTGRGNRV